MRSVRFIVVAFWFIALMGISSSALAFDPGGGVSNSPYWKVTITQSGTVSGDFMGSSFSYDAANPNDGYSIGVVCSGPAYIPSGKTGNINRTISYHVKAAWVNTDGSAGANPTKNVMMKTTSSASWHGPSGKATGSCSNGIGSPKVIATSGAGETMSGDKWELKDGSSGTIEYDISTSATVAVTGQVNQNTYGCSTSVSASASPITLELSGVITDSSGNSSALIGQGVGGWISSGALLSSSQSGWQWSVGGDTFQSWSVSSDSSSSTFVGGPGPLNNASFHCYWKRKDKLTVSCSFNLNTPSGTFNVYCEKEVVIYEPENFMLDGTPGPVSISNAGSLAGQPSTNGNPPVPGMQFFAHAATPVKFAPIGSDTGKINFGQIVNGYMENDPPTETYATNGYALDNTWPYGTPAPADYNIWGLDMKTNDNPFLGFNPSADFASANLQFKMYLMYTPPGLDVQTVPLMLLQWAWQTYCSKDINTNIWSFSTFAPSLVYKSTPQRCYDHPVWTSKWTNYQN